MLVADRSALVSLETISVLATVCEEYDVNTTETVVAELESTAEYDDTGGEAAQSCLDRRERLRVHTVDDPLTSSRIDVGEGSCAVLAVDRDADFLLTDDLRALPELAGAVAAQVAISPIVLRALVNRGVLTADAARDHLDTLAERRRWLGSPIYRRATSLFDGVE